MFNPSLKKALPLIFALSVILRLFSAVYQGATVEALPGTYDQVSYHALATRVLSGHGFSFDTGWWPATQAGAPTAHWSYLYTLYLAFVYLVFGANPLAARCIQSLIVGVLHPLLCWRIGNRLFGKNAGLIASLLTAIYGYFIYYAGALMTEAFFMVAVLWVMDIATVLASRDLEANTKTQFTWIRLGIAIGAAVLLRQVFLLFTPILIAWLIYVLRREARERKRRGLFTGILTACLVMSLMILPWTIRNYIAFKGFVLLNTNAGFAFFWGNHPIHGTEFIPVFSENASYRTLIPEELRRLNEASLDKKLLQEGLRFVSQDPQRYFRLSLSRTKEYFRFWPSKESSRISNIVRLLSFGLFLPFMGLGIVVVSISLLKGEGGIETDFSKQPVSGHFLLLLFAAGYTLIHLLTWSLIRYRLPVDSILILYAAAGVLWLVQRFKASRTISFKESVI
jgi:4-amino-4-deoxy-L-arabinose transferase-like glycosyltransferase